MFLLEIVFLLFVIAAAILLVQGVRKVPVQYAKRIVGNKQPSMVSLYLGMGIVLNVGLQSSEYRDLQKISKKEEYL